MSIVAYRDLASGRYPITLADIRDSVPMLFGDEPGSEVLDAAGVEPVARVHPPSFDSATHILMEGRPERIGNAWRQTWIVAAVPPPPVPPEVTPAQAKIALYDAGLYGRVKAIIDGSDAYEPMRIWWESALVWRLDNPNIHALAAVLKLTDDQVDDLFRAAAKVAQ